MRKAIMILTFLLPFLRTVHKNNVFADQYE